MAYRRFLGLDIMGRAPDRSAISQNRRRRFNGSGFFRETQKRIRGGWTAVPLIVNGVKSKTNDKGHGITNHCTFHVPVPTNIGDELTEPIECPDTYDIVLSEKREDSIEKMEGEFEYKLQGELKDVQNGIVDVYGFIIHIVENRIPGDITNGMFIQFIVSRLEIW